MQGCIPNETLVPKKPKMNNSKLILSLLILNSYCSIEAAESVPVVQNSIRKCGTVPKTLIQLKKRDDSHAGVPTLRPVSRRNSVADFNQVDSTPKIPQRRSPINGSVVLDSGTFFR